MTQRLAVRADLLDFPEDPGWQVDAGPAVRYQPDHWLVVEDGQIFGMQPGTQHPG